MDPANNTPELDTVSSLLQSFCAGQGSLAPSNVSLRKICIFSLMALLVIGSTFGIGLGRSFASWTINEALSVTNNATTEPHLDVVNQTWPIELHPNGTAANRNATLAAPLPDSAHGKSNRTTILWILPLVQLHFNIAKDNVVPFFHSDSQEEAPRYELLLIFSNEQDLRTFGGCNYTHVTCVSIPQELQYIIPKLSFKPTLVTFKKWFGIQHARKTLRRTFDFYVAIDAEVMFLRPLDDTFFRRLRKNHRIVIGDRLANGMPNTRYINEAIKRHFAPFREQYDPALWTLLFEKAFYSWFSDVPVYAEEELDEFFAFTNFSTDPIKAVDHGFDHLFYQYWLVLHKKATVYLLGDTCGVPQIGFSLEMLSKAADLKQIQRCYQPLWVAKKCYEDIVSKPLQHDLIQHLYVVFHLDR